MRGDGKASKGKGKRVEREERNKKRKKKRKDNLWAEKRTHIDGSGFGSVVAQLS